LVVEEVVLFLRDEEEFEMLMISEREEEVVEGD
jgi:hypothetical protein